MSNKFLVRPVDGVEIYVTLGSDKVRFADAYDQAMTILDNAGVLLPTNLAYVDLITKKVTA